MSSEAKQTVLYEAVQCCRFGQTGEYMTCLKAFTFESLVGFFKHWAGGTGNGNTSVGLLWLFVPQFA